MLYYQSMHKNFEYKERKKHISNLIQFFFIFQFFSTFSLLGRVTLSRSSFIQTNIFRKKKTLFFFIIFNMAFFSTPFIPDMSVFFVNFQLLKNIYFFLKKMNKTLVFSIFHLLFKVKHHPTSRKKQNEKLFIFFQNLKTYFFCFDKSQIL